MQRATTGLWVSAALILLIIGGAWVVAEITEKPTWAVAVDLIWKILVIGFLWDISAKLGRGRSSNK